MRYLLDTNIFIYWSTDQALLDKDVFSALSEPDAELYLSSESVKELIVGYNNKSFILYIFVNLVYAITNQTLIFDK
jgi:PIN domain nuclease of toxin-antitoxin system